MIDASGNNIKWINSNIKSQIPCFLWFLVSIILYIYTKSPTHRHTHTHDMKAERRLEKGRRFPEVSWRRENKEKV